MIEVNLLPSTTGRKKSARKGRSASFLSGVAIPGDRWVIGAGVLCLAALIFIGWHFFQVAGKAEELRVEIEAAQRDSARFADVIRRTETLQARRDSIVERVAAIQQIDGSRYIWPHLMNETARALPAFTWITRFDQVAPSPNLTFQIRGRAANYFALTTFMENLEASYFIQGVRLIASDQVAINLPAGERRNVYEFQLEGRWQDPPPEAIQQEALFGPSVLAPDAEPAPAETDDDDSAVNGEAY